MSVWFDFMLRNGPRNVQHYIVCTQYIIYFRISIFFWVFSIFAKIFDSLKYKSYFKKKEKKIIPEHADFVY